MKETSLEPKSPAKRRRTFNIRLATQIFFFSLVSYLALGKNLAERIPGWEFLPDVSLHSVCPFGGVVTLYSLITDGSYIQRIHASSVILAGLAVILSILFGPVLCGWICPLGSLQDWVSNLGRRLMGNRYNHLIPAQLDKILRQLRYGLLAWVIYVTAVSGKLVFESIDPYYALFNFWTGEVAIGGLVILGITLVLSLFVARPWCKYACPYGALLGLFNKIRIFTIHRQASSCISCNRCNRDCPMNISVSTAGAVRDAQCISCLECTSDRSCPVPETVTIELLPETFNKVRNS
ncbi:MAG: 4Fe-4S binding protein [Eubacteriales bacterium]|nr:4Fe-4S binding protein [Eubacteriales bacterium]